MGMIESDCNQVIGRGSYAKIMLVEHRIKKKVYAMKIIKKESLNKTVLKTRIKNERTVLEVMNSPFVVNLQYAFQTTYKLYLVNEFMIGGNSSPIHSSPLGDLLRQLRISVKFPEERARFYAAEVLLGLDSLHSNGIIYRYLQKCLTL